MSTTKTKFQLPALGYDYAALEPVIDAATMKIHHTKHHQGYVDKLNKALEGHADLQGRSLEELLRNIGKIPEDIREAVRNNGGGHANHSLFWKVIAPGGENKPGGALAEAIKKHFGDLEGFQKKFKEAATGQFGSGWAWLCLAAGELKIHSTPNQDSPHMKGHIPLLGLDVWEHAYYLNYQNRRPDYVDAFFKIINWTEVSKRFVEA